MKKKLTITALFTLMLILLTTTGAYAYQIIPTGIPLNQPATTWITVIRQMESETQVMGLTEEINTTTAESATDTSNNIDVHMQKNTEYGAVVILGASEYGKQGKGEERYMNKGATTTSGTDIKASSTGNVYGVYELGYSSMNVTNSTSEWTAAGGNEFLSNSIASRYINIYMIHESSEKKGDATVGTAKWHGANYGSWIDSASCGFVRGIGGAFSYQGQNYYARDSRNSRPAIVCGTGF